MKKMTICKNVIRGTWLWSQSGMDIDWWREGWETPDDYYRLGCSWDEGWNNKLTQFLGAGTTLTGWGSPCYFVIEGEVERLPNLWEKIQIIAGLLVLNFLPYNLLWLWWKVKTLAKMRSLNNIIFGIMKEED